MNNFFLSRVSSDLMDKFGTNLSRVAVVFPNKRAALFMNEHLARKAGRPIWSPVYMTISELFRKHSETEIADPIKLVADLHKVYTSITGKDETLDQFFSWGQLLISDFDDIDKNMADASKVLANIADLKELDDLSYLNEEQKALLKRFFNNFAVDPNTELKHRFLQIWSNLYKIYTTFNEKLQSQNLAYEGALYCKVACQEELPLDYDSYVFVGFNMLQKVEQHLFSRIKREGKAYFYWDFDHYYMKGNESGHFIRQYLEQFPNELPNDDPVYDNLSKQKDITYIAATTETAQARYVAQWLSEEGKERIKDGRSTAIVLCDESLLQTVVHCLPEEVKKVNITTGYPLSQSPFAALLNLLIGLQTDGYNRQNSYYRLSYVLKVLRHPYACHICEQNLDMIEMLTSKNIFRPKRQIFEEYANADLLFTNIYDQEESPTLMLSRWLTDILMHIGTQTKHLEDPFFQESLFRTYTLANRLQGLIASGDLEIDIVTFRRLFWQLLQGTTIPFHGEPAEGLQIMGVLETRNLDFDHILILSCNEGNMPKGVNDSSFIPYAVRKAYGLTTIDHKVAIYAYYFHRLIQRASDITITYNHATEDGNRGEMSRFMLQFMVENSQQQIRQAVLRATNDTMMGMPKPIKKDEKIQKKLATITQLSPTAIAHYLRCQLQFYFERIAMLKEPDNTEDDDIDNRVFGNIFHRAAQLIYDKMQSPIQKSAIEAVLNDASALSRVVDQAFNENLFNSSYTPTSEDPEANYNGLQLINRNVIIFYLKQLLKIDMQLAPFSIVDCEFKVYTDDGDYPVRIKGVVDRMDKVSMSDGSECIRVVDYKTGSRTQQPIDSVEDIFRPEFVTKRHTDYYLQTMLYASIISKDDNLNPQHLPVSPALLFIQHTTAKDYDPRLEINKQRVADVGVYANDFKEQLQNLIKEMLNPDTDFTPTDDKRRCESCPFKKTCYS
ncbi:MAG: PD-(D/E)XK nuclease family protein [Prevotella sp.]|nr:PD-(D/E)XK nuclease family protein [Prevotella sp.]